VTAATARDVLTALYRHYTPRWAMLTEVTAADPDTDIRQASRIDALLIRRRPNSPRCLERFAIEVKVSRSDFLADVRNPDKQAPWRRLAHRHAYAVPAGLVTPQELPAGSGLLVVDRAWDETWRVRTARRCPGGNDPGDVPLTLILDACYRASRDGAALRGYTWNSPGDDPQELRARVKHLERELEKTRGRADREATKRRDWQRRYALHEPPACATCGNPLHPGRGRWATEWVHRDPDQAAACEQLRKALPDANVYYTPSPVPVGWVDRGRDRGDEVNSDRPPVQQHRVRGVRLRAGSVGGAAGRGRLLGVLLRRDPVCIAVQTRRRPLVPPLHRAPPRSSRKGFVMSTAAGIELTEIFCTSGAGVRW
jgi:hypothetical protein